MAQSLILASFTNGLLGFTLFILSLFLVLLILVQRGRGGGLTGALGGPGGQSAFGTKAGDLFTRITSFVALGWIALCAFTMWLMGPHLPPAQAIAPSVSASPAGNTSSTKDLIDLGTPKATDATAPAKTDSAAPANETTLTAPETKPSETKPADAPAAETKPAETKPADAPETETPAAETPAAEASATETPAAEAPAAAEPAAK